MFLKNLDGCDDKPILSAARSMLEDGRKYKENTTKPSKILDNYGNN